MNGERHAGGLPCRTATSPDRAVLAARPGNAAGDGPCNAEMLRALSHEFRTPLNAIIGFAQMLEYELAGPLNRRQRDYAGDIGTCGHQVLRLFDDLIALLSAEPPPVATRDAIIRLAAPARLNDRPGRRGAPSG